MDKESIALSEDHDESISDIAERPPAFLNRMQIFKEEFEKIKVSVYTHAYNKSYKIVSKLANLL